MIGNDQITNSRSLSTSRLYFQVESFYQITPVRLFHSQWCVERARWKIVQEESSPRWSPRMIGKLCEFGNAGKWKLHSGRRARHLFQPFSISRSRFQDNPDLRRGVILHSADSTVQQTVPSVCVVSLHRQMVQYKSARVVNQVTMYVYRRKCAPLTRKKRRKPDKNQESLPPGRNRIKGYFRVAFV